MTHKILVCPKCQSINRTDLERAKTSSPLCGKCGTSLEVNHLHSFRDDAQFDKLIQLAQLPVVVDVYADWCGPCRMYAPIFKQVAQELWDKAEFFKLDSEKLPAISQRYGIRGIPTTLFFFNHQLVKSQSGLLDATQLKSLIQSVHHG
ncbi:MAG: thioredoxin [Bdellovibrionaceae bacterium]|nr:thioredoxin [Pseudobdellovibrionaceae bacterium]|tara:strand:- start:121 stop:564 length:444 start_codon:yes stop_codon:yes gene_type:complete